MTDMVVMMGMMGPMMTAMAFMARAVMVGGTGIPALVVRRAWIPSLVVIVGRPGVGVEALVLMMVVMIMMVVMMVVIMMGIVPMVVIRYASVSPICNKK